VDAVSFFSICMRPTVAESKNVTAVYKPFKKDSK